MKGRTIISIMAVCVGGLAVGPQASAAVLHTPPLLGGSLGLACEVKNLGTTPAEVTIEIILRGGPLHANRLTTTIDPGESASVVGVGSVGVCRFTVAGSRRKFVASGCVLTSNGCGAALAAQ